MPDDMHIQDIIGQEGRIVRSGMTALPLSGAKRSEHRRGLLRHMETFGLTQEDVAKSSRFSQTYVNNIITESGNMPEATRDQTLVDLEAWINKDLRARETQRPGGFVYTVVAERLIGLAKRLTERPDAALAYAPAGAGKSFTIEAIPAEIPSAVVLRVTQETRSYRAFLRALYNVIRRRRPRSGSVTLSEVIDLLRKPERVATNNLLIIDEAHRLQSTAIEACRDILDVAKCSILFVGTIDLRDRLSDDEDDSFGQWSSRIGLRIDLAPELTRRGRGGAAALGGKLYTVAQVREIFKAGKLKLHVDAARLLCEIANTMTGHLRRVARVYDLAVTVARRKHADEIRPEHIHRAIKGVQDEESRIELPAAEPAAMEATA